MLQAVAAVIPYQTYHIKLAVADAFDYSYDSGVFIEAESFTGIPLPVELLSFVAELRNTIVELKWATASEQNSSHFDVQRSADGITSNLLTELLQQEPLQLRIVIMRLIINRYKLRHIIA